MYARSTTLTAEPSRAEQGVAFVRDQVWPAVRDMEGCLGLSMLLDRGSGRSIITTSWESERALRDSASAVLPLRDAGVELTGAARPVVEEWEIAVMHRAHATSPGAWVRTAWSRIAPGHVEGALEFFKHALMPEIERLDGFASASLLIDRAAGRGVTSVAFDTREAMELSRDQADYLRTRSTQEANVEFLDVAELELALAHLHVPELV